MPKHEAIEVPKRWTLLTDEPVERVTVQNRGSFEMEISPYAGTYSDKPQGLVVPARTALINRRLSDLFPGAVLAGATSDLYARALDTATMAFISHA